MNPKTEDPQKPLISKRRFNIVEGLVGASEARKAEHQVLAFSPRDFVLCGLPYKRVKSNEYERINGNRIFRVVADPKFGLPFGQDRLLPIWLATAFQIAGQPKDNLIWFRCLADILRAFGIPDGGISYKLLMERIHRVFGASYFATETRLDGRILRAARYHLISRFEFYIDKKAHPNQNTLWHNFIQLSSDFADDLRNASIPIDLNSVKALKERPMALDLYIWQAWRSYRLSKSKCKLVAVPLFGPEGLAFQLGTRISDKYKVRQQINRAQCIVKSVWSQCPNFIKGDRLIVREGLAVNPKSKLYLPGVSDAPARYPNPLGEGLRDILVFKGDRPDVPPVDEKNPPL